MMRRPAAFLFPALILLASMAAGHAPASGEVRQTAPCAIADLYPGNIGVGRNPPAGWPEPRQLWRYSRGEGQTVAVIDTGVAPHPRLRHLEGGGDLVGGQAAAAGTTGSPTSASGASTPRAQSPGPTESPGLADCDAHGTLVAGLIAAAPSDADRFAGIAPAAHILSIRQSSAKFTDTGSGGAGRSARTGYAEGAGTIGSLARAIRMAVDQGATVINISEVACGSGVGILRSDTLAQAVAYAATADTVIVAAAGNTGGNSARGATSGTCRQNTTVRDPLRPDDRGWATAYTDVAPAHYADTVLTVGSVDPDGSPSDFSLAGPWVSVAAPGTAVTSLANDAGGGLANRVRTEHGVTGIEGTSFAAPLVAGLAALIRSRYPNLTAPQVVHRITATAIPGAHGWEPTVGYGTVDPLAALTAPEGAVAMDAEGVGADAGRYADSASGRPADVSAALAPPVDAGDAGSSPTVRAFVGSGAAAGVLACLLTAAAVRRRARR